MGIVKKDWLETGRLFFVSFYGIEPDVVVAKNGFRLEIVYHIHLIENTGFLEDLFCKTELFRALRVGANTNTFGAVPSWLAKDKEPLLSLKRFLSCLDLQKAMLKLFT